MARVGLDTAIRISAEVKGGGNIDRVKRSLQDLAKGSQVTARDMGALRSATFQFARANDSTIGGIRNSITAFRGLQEQAKIGSREFQRYGSEIQRLEGKLKGLDGTAEAAGASLGQNLAAGLATAGIGRALQGITAQAGRFDAELRKAAAIEGGAGSFEVLRKEIERVAATAAGTPTEVAALGTALSRAGFSAQETTQALAGIVRGAEATSITFEEMGSIAADNLRAFGLQTAETARVVDVLTQTANKSNQTVLDLGESMKYAAPIARSLGLPLEDLAATMALLANNGIRGSDAGTALRTGLTRLQIAASGSNEELEGLTRGNVLLAKAMRSLGAEIIDTSGNLLPLDQVILSLRSNLQGLSAGRRAEIAKALFGDEAGSKFLALLNSSEDQIRKMFAAVRDSGGVAESTQKKMQGFDYSVKVLGGNIEYLTNQIGGMIGAALKPLIDGLNAAIGAAQNLPGPIKAIGAAAAAAGATTLGLVVAVNALKLGLAALGGISAVTAALTGYKAAAVGATAAQVGLNLAVLANPWVALAAGITAATVALATYQSQAQRVGAGARTGGAAELAAARGRLGNTGQEISLLQAQRRDARGPAAASIDRRLNKLQAEQRQLRADIEVGGRRVGAVSAPNATGAPIGAVVGGATNVNRGGSGGGTSSGAAFKLSSRGQALVAAAKKLGVSPLDLATIISFETGGTFSPSIKGGAGGNYMGLIQFGPSERKTYGAREGQSFEEQVTGPVVRYFQDRFGKVGMSTQGATLLDLYTTVLAGNPKANRNARDSFGTSPVSGVQRMGPHRQKALQTFFGGSAQNTEYGPMEQAEIANNSFEQMRDQLKQADELNSKFRDQLAIIQETDSLKKIMLGSEIRQNEITSKYNELRSNALSADETTLINSSEILERRISQIEHEQQINDLLEQRVQLMIDVTRAASMPTVYNELETQDAALKSVLDKYPAIGAAADAAATMATAGMSEMIAGAKSAEEVFANFLRSVADTLMDTAKQMIAQYIAIGIARMIAGLGGGGAPGGFAPSGPLAAVGNINPMPASFVPSFAGGGFTGTGARSGGLDGQGGFMAMLHPRESVIDHTRPGSASGTTTQVVVNVDASGNTNASGDAGKAEQLGRVVSKAVQAELIRQKLPGGLLA